MKFNYLITTLLLMLLSVAVYAQNEKAYVVVNNGIATFYYNNSKPSGALSLRTGPTDNNWTSEICNSIKKVEFDKSFKDFSTDCWGWFYHFFNLTEVVGMENLTVINYCVDMFSGCASLKTLDLSKLNTTKITNTGRMFSQCGSLQTIYVGDNWKIDNVNSSDDMFDGCIHLYGGKGTSVKDKKVYDATYAKIDGGSDAPGYFTKVGTAPFIPAMPYMIVKNGVATYYFDNSQQEGEGVYYLETFTTSDGECYKVAQTITEVVIDKSFKNYKPTTLSSFFSSFQNLTKISGIENINTENVSTMSYMFNYCRKLESLDLSGWNTSKVTNLHSMFDFCESLESVNLGSFNTSQVTNMGRMFYACKQLVTIFVGNGWSTSNVTNSDDIFWADDNLCGGQGTYYKKAYVHDASYAKIDGGENAPGYFTKVGEKPYDPTHPYITISNGVATFYYNASFPNGAKSIQNTMMEGEWTEDLRKTIVGVQFDKSFNNYKPTTCAYWFYNFENLSKIYDITNLNTEAVTDMGSMFYGCKKLDKVDLSGFNTADVQYMSYMFYGCTNLTTLDLSSFDTEKVTSMASMFASCTSLKTIYVSEKWNTSAVKNFEYIFNLDKKLYGGKGTHCTESDIKFACIDGGEDNPGYLTKSGEAAFEAPLTYGKFDSRTGTLTLGYSKTIPNGAKEINAEKTTTESWIASEITEAKNVKKIVIDKSFADFQPTRCYYWFYGCTEATEISGLENLNTEIVTDMRCMFAKNMALTTLDLRGFNTAKVKDMYEMFFSCDNIKTILVSDKWTTENVEVSGAMFRFCSKLEGDKGTKYADETDATLGISYAKIDGGKDNPGYFSELKAVSVEISSKPKTEYTLGEDFSAENGTITVKYNDNTTQTADLSKAEISGFDNAKVGEQTLKVVFEGFETELIVTVKEKGITPVSSVVDSPSVKVWSYNRTIYLESAPDTKYTIIDLNGRIIKSSTTKSTKEEIKINKHGIVVVIVNGDSYKLAVD